VFVQSVALINAAIEPPAVVNGEIMALASRRLASPGCRPVTSTSTSSNTSILVRGRYME
jgi:hypothetical protein